MCIYETQKQISKSKNTHIRIKKNQGFWCVFKRHVVKQNYKLEYLYLQSSNDVYNSRSLTHTYTVAHTHT